MKRLIRVKQMKTHEIIKQNSISNEAILFEHIADKLKSLYVYYKSLYCNEPILMVTCVTNACCYVKIIDADEFMYVVEEWANGDEAEIETINFNSKMLKDLI